MVICHLEGRIQIVPNYIDTKKMRYICTLCSSHITVAMMAVLWAGCKNADDCPLPSTTPHDTASASDTTEASKENIAELSRTDPDNETRDSQEGSIAENSNTSLDISSIDSQSVTSEATEPYSQAGPLIDQEVEGEARPPLQIEVLVQEVEKEIQRLDAEGWILELTKRKISTTSRHQCPMLL